jgi:hypothetical protein
MVSKPGGGRSSSKYAPVNEQSRGGVVKYLNNGADAVIESRREDAYRQMYSECSGKYKIDAEGPREEGGVVTPISGGSYYSSSFQCWYIQFSCVAQLR